MAKDKYIFDDLELSGDYETDESFDLDSILAEFHGGADGTTGPQASEASAEIPGRPPRQGQDVTSTRPEPPEVLETAKPELEATRQFAPVAREPEPEPEEPVKRGLFRRGRSKRREDEPEEAEAPEPELRTERFVVKLHDEKPAYETKPDIDLSVFEEPEEERWDRRMEEFLNSIDDGPSAGDGEPEYSAPDTSELREEVSRTEDLGEELMEEDEGRRRRGIFGLFRRRDRESEDEIDDAEIEDDDELTFDESLWEDEGPEYIDDEDFYVNESDPDFKRESAKYAARVPSLRFRILGLAVICIAMFFISLAGIRGTPGLFGIGDNHRASVATLLIMELVAVGLGLDVMIRGLEDILTFSAGAESLVFVSCVMSILDGFTMLTGGGRGLGMPMALVSSVSLLGALAARKSFYMAMCDSLRASRASSTTYGVTADFESMEARHILKKVTGADQGFYTKLTGRDKGEKIYDRLTPLMLIVAFVLASLACIRQGKAGYFAHSFSIMTAVAASFSATFLFALPFRYAASNLKKAGGALAGFIGAREIYYTDGALITDQDIFPTGSVTLSGLKIFEGVNQQKVIVDTASLIIASDSGLRRVFEELLKSQGLTRRRTDDFSCYDGGGIGALVDGERVLVGTGAFMNLMGIRVPDSVNTSSSVFTAINDELAGVFSLNYIPSNSVQSALVALLNTKTNLLMAVRDFNVTPNTVKQKFKVSMDGVEYLPIETTYDLSQNVISPENGVSAVLCRGGLAPFAEVITRGRLRKLITELNTWLTVAGTAIGGIIMFFLCWTGAFASATAVNIFLFMGVIALAVYIISQGTRRRMK